MKKQTVVIKLGTSVLTQGARKIDKAHMVEIVRQCASAHKAGHRIIIVTSGAIASGREHLEFPALPDTVAAKQLLAAVGQSRLIQIWEQLFALYGLHVGQMLLTRADLEDRERFLNARDMLLALLEYGIVPVINENDAVATAEIKIGDNDNLSALAAILADADLLLLLTDQEGLYTSDPRFDSQAMLIPHIKTIDESVYTLAGGSVSGLGTGGMATKIQAAAAATRAGVKVVITNGAHPEHIERILSGETRGTVFSPSTSPLEARKRWLFGPPPAGGIAIDSGAAKALLSCGSSLLPKGITAVQGIFARGEVVRIIAPDATDVAHGVTRYSSEDLLRIAGKHSESIREILGYTHGPNAVHRDDCILAASSGISHKQP